MKEYHVYDGDEFVGVVYGKNHSHAAHNARYEYESIRWTRIVDPAEPEYD